MKGIQGLLIAAGLGIVGAFCNWYYISQQARAYQRVGFVAVSPQAQINPGDRFTRDHFRRVDVPEPNVGLLDKVAVKWGELDTIVGDVATRSYIGGEILLRQDLRTPAQRDLSQLLGANEGLRWVPVDPRAFVPEHLNPGDRVSFILPQFASPSPRDTTGMAVTATQTIGPFEVVALGTRKGRRELLQAKGDSPAKESLVGIRVTIMKDGSLDAQSQRLFDALRQTNYQSVQVMLHSSRSKQES